MFHEVFLEDSQRLVLTDSRLLFIVSEGTRAIRFIFLYFNLLYYLVLPTAQFTVWAKILRGLVDLPERTL
jgi:hypothetical protein